MAYGGMRSGRTRLALLVVLLGGVSLLPAPASGSCAGPALTVVGTLGEGPPTLHHGGLVTVHGSNFVDGCDDQGGSSWFGCSSNREEEVPLRDVALVLRQGQRSWTLGTADAGAGDQLGRVVWQVRVPSDVDAGPALLVADGARLRVAVSARLHLDRPDGPAS